MGDGCIRGPFGAFEGEWVDLCSVRVQWVGQDELLQVTTGCLDFVGDNQPLAHLSQRKGMKRWRREGRPQRRVQGEVWWHPGMDGGV